MTNNKRIYLIFFFMLSCFLSCQAQPNTDAILNEGELNFLYQVKVIDEFMERFNNEQTLLTKHQSLGANLTDSIKRTYLIASLFDRQNKSIDLTMVRNFIGKITSKVQLNYYSKNWYAVVSCAVVYKGKPQNAQIVMQVEETSPKQSKWVIVGVKANFLESKNVAKDTTRIINPMAHNTSFNILDRVLGDSSFLNNSLANSFEYNQLSIFLYELQEGNLKFKQTNKTTYHFLDVGGYNFMVDYQNRNDKNSGWLIGSLQLAKNNKLYLRNLGVSNLAK